MNTIYFALWGLATLLIIYLLSVIIVRFSSQLDKNINLLTKLLMNGDLDWDKIEENDLILINSCKERDAYGDYLR